MEDKFYYDGLNIYSKKEIDINKLAEYSNVNASNILLDSVYRNYNYLNDQNRYEIENNMKREAYLNWFI